VIVIVVTMVAIDFSMLLIGAAAEPFVARDFHADARRDRDDRAGSPPT
jgi:hypothetical protein